jgi:hypothetical protein
VNHLARLAPLVLAFVALEAASPVDAQRAAVSEEPQLSVTRAPARLDVTLEPFPEAGPWKRKLILRSLRAQEVVRDRRLLELTVLEARERGRPRRHVCRYPGAPARPVEARVAAMSAGETYVEWLDLRELCWGRAARVLESGEVTVEVSYGFRARSRAVVREEGERRPPHRVAGDAFTFALPTTTPAPSAATSSATTPGASPASATPASATPSSATPASALTVSLAPTSTAGTPVLSVTIRGEGGGRIYVRDDLFSFDVRGPLGSVRCAIPRTTIVPIVDFYRRLARPTRTSIAASIQCPEDTFAVAGVYEVVPIVDLVYDGARYDLEAVTGRFEGAPAAVRITSREYVEQRVEDLLAILRTSTAETP